MKYFFSLWAIATSIMLVSCSNNRTPDFTSQQVQQKDANEHNLLRADPRFIAWLEKSSLLQHAPEKLAIVSGTALAWQSPSLSANKENLLLASPTWLFINPWDIYTKKTQNSFQALIQQNIPQQLKKIGIQGLYLSPTNNPSQSITSYGFSNEISSQKSTLSTDFTDHLGTNEQYTILLQSKLLMAGNMLEPAMGIGSDFLLALRAVRTYPALFMMTELPPKLWSEFSLNDILTDNSLLASKALNAKEHAALAKNGIIPPAFNRDIFPDGKQHGFAITDPILGYDGIKRRWIYRYAQDIYHPLFNFNDPSLQSQRIFGASIIQQVGILHQPLVGLNVGDLWAQERIALTTQINTDKLHDKSLSEPALSTLRAWNRSIHGFGAWSIIRDAFPMEWMPLLTEEASDLLADTILMPALEASITMGNSKPLYQSLNKSLNYNINFSHLWHGSQDTYQKIFIKNPFQFPTSMSLALSVAKINKAETKILEKNSPLMQIEFPELFQRFSNAKDIQFLYIAFPTLLPGLPFLSGHDIRGTFTTDTTTLPKYELIKSKNTTVSNMLHNDIINQQADSNSLIKKLMPLWQFRQKYALATATILAPIENTEKEIFGLIMQNNQGKHILLVLNCSNKSITSNIKIPMNILGKKTFRTAVNALTSTKKYVHSNMINISFKPWQIHAFTLTPS